MNGYSSSRAQRANGGKAKNEKHVRKYASFANIVRASFSWCSPSSRVRNCLNAKQNIPEYRVRATFRRANQVIPQMNYCARNVSEHLIDTIGIENSWQVFKKEVIQCASKLFARTIIFSNDAFAEDH